jgi:succinate-semialdehyde dehydrogenase / glutarate-semialdehyde dehydrogenase
VNETGLLVGGRWRSGGTPTEVLDRYSGEPVAVVEAATVRHVDSAIGLAARATAHRPPPPQDRAEVLRRAAEILFADRDNVLRDYVAETGFTITEADAELTRACATLRQSAEECLRLAGESAPARAPSGSGGQLEFARRVPVGIVAAILPFNAPLSTLASKVGPALAAGNAVLVKPAAATPLSAIRVCAALLAAGLPEPYLSLLPGPGKIIGQRLVSDYRVGFVAFTGSRKVGSQIRQNSGLAKTSLELGATSATIVCADADIEAAAATIAEAGYRKAGQVCTSVQRVLADSAVSDDLTSALRERVRKLAAGDPRLWSTNLGPMISETEAARACDWVQDATRAGARVLSGGSREAGLMVATLVADPPDQSRIMRQEIFAPIVAVRRVRDQDEAIRIINGSRYRMNAEVFTRDIGVAFAAARRMNVSSVLVNCSAGPELDVQAEEAVIAGRDGPGAAAAAIGAMSDTRVVVLSGLGAVG